MFQVQSQFINPSRDAPPKRPCRRSRRGRRDLRKEICLQSDDPHLLFNANRQEPRTRLNEVKFLQINAHKSREAMTHICKETDDLGEFCCLITEPLTYQSNGILKPYGLNPRCNYILSPSGRAAIYYSQGIKLWQLTSFTEKDQAAAVWDHVIPGMAHRQRRRFIILSTYWDNNNKNIPDELEKVLTYADNSRERVLLAMDSNAHSKAFGSTTQNSRGHTLDEFTTLHNLHILNRGQSPTFHNTRGHTSIIDVTLCSIELANLFSDWRVDNTYLGSDHLPIRFEYTSTPVSYRSTRHLHKVNWTAFSEDLLSKLQTIHLPNLSSILDIEIITHHLHIAINEVMDKHAPLIEVKVKGSTNRWWNANLAELQPRVAGAFHRWRDHPTEINLKLYKDLKLELTKLIRKSKRDSWRDFCTESNTPKLTAQLNKILRNNKIKDISLLQNDNGDISADPTSSLNLLLDKSFPNSTAPPDDWQDIQLNRIQSLHEETGYFFPKKAPWRNQEEIREAINDFDPLKAPGPDGIKPIVLQHFPNEALTTLQYLFDSCLTAGYTPTLWRESQVIYIPKPGKSDYGKTNSYRPISLTSFLFKTMEKMVAKHVETQYLATSPYHRSQHAFRSGQSTISALSALINKIEEGIAGGGFVVGVFLDVAAAFDNLTFDSIIKALRKRGIDEQIISWYEHYINNRTCVAELKGIKLIRLILKGTAQGAVLSPILWNMVADDILHKFNKIATFINGFADDLALLRYGKTLTDICKHLNNALSKVHVWAEENGLQLSPEKTHAVIFTRKNKYVVPHGLLHINNVPINFTKTVKYLGLLIDHKLSWKPHIDAKLANCKKHFYQLRSAIGQNWGLNTQSILWLFTAVIRPSLTYGSYIWAHALTSTQQNSLASFQRSILKSTATLHNTTPGATLNLVFDVLPIQNFVDQEVVLAHLRSNYKQACTWKKLVLMSQRSSHKFYAHNLFLQIFPKSLVTDMINKTFPPRKLYHIDHQSLTENKHNPIGDIQLFTDGSKIDGKTGYGAYISINEVQEHDLAERIGNNRTVFQAEQAAIKHSANWAVKYTQVENLSNLDIHFYVDSQAAIQSLDSRKINSSLTLGTIKSLNSLASNNQVTIHWVKAHVGHLGNEFADQAAKLGASLTRISTNIPPSKSELTTKVKQYFRQRWATQWLDTPGHNISKVFYPHPDTKKARSIINLPRKALSRMIQATTGFDFFSYCMFTKSNIGVSANCRLCGDSEETGEHIVLHCPKLLLWRANTLGLLPSSDVSTWEWDGPQMNHFLQHPTIINLEETNKEMLNETKNSIPNPSNDHSYAMMCQSQPVFTRLVTQHVFYSQS